MRVGLLHLRLLGLRAALVVFAGLAVGVVLLRPRFWEGVWPATGAAGQVPAYFLAILAAGTGAWLSGAVDRERLGEQLAAAATDRRRAEATRFGVASLVFLSAYVLGQALAFALTAPGMPPGLPIWFGYVVMGVIAVELALAWGWLVGRFLSSVFAPLVAVVGWLIFSVTVAGRADLTVVSGEVWQAPGVPALLVRAALVATLVLVLIATPPPRQVSGRRRWIALLPVLAAAGALAGVGVTSGVVDRDIPADTTCVQGRIDVCIWAEHRPYIPMIRSFDSAVAALPAALSLPDRVVEYGLRRTQVDYAGQHFTQLEGIDISEGNRSALALGLSDAILAETTADCDFTALDGSTLETVRRWVELRLNGAEPDYGVSGLPADLAESWAAADALYTEENPAEQEAWITQQVQAQRTAHCVG